MKRKPFSEARRGMLLLMVILMLTLFIAAGAMLLTIAARARASARANALAGQQTGGSDGVARDALDAALLAFIRGATSGTNGSVTVTGTQLTVLENLLEDKYGPSITGTGSGLSGTNTPVMSFTLSTTISSTTARALGGRVATIVPTAGDGDIASFRILAVSSPAPPNFTCQIANLPGSVVKRLPSSPFTVVINGREFTPLPGSTTPEPYDAYDDANQWLAQPVQANGQLSGTSGSFDRLSFAGAAATATVDNDNDGVLDGVWIPSSIASGSATLPPFVIPDRPSALGGTLRFQVSYLILDLDGRININAAGMAAQPGSYANTPNTPIGMGHGPADLTAPLLFPPTLPDVSGTYAVSSVWTGLLQSGTPTTTPASPTDAQRRTPPVVGAIDGRSGVNGVPGAAGDDSIGSQQTSTAANAALGGVESMYSATISGLNAVADLKAQTRVYMTGTAAGATQITPTLNFYRPTWSGTAGADGVDDPYEARLDADAPRTGLPRRPLVTGTSNDDGIFTLAELERILRPNDPDAPQLPQRLAAGLEDVAQRSRLTITTDSWSTPGLTGLAALQMESFLTGTTFPGSIALTGTDGIVSADVAAGLRFNINRPVLSGSSTAAGTQQQQFCKDLYTLVMALATGAGAPPTPDVATQFAQWAVNVLDFRDADSVMTRFAYDTNLTDGWQVDAASPIVYGAERPEIVIVETAAWRNETSGTSQLFVNLHRPASQAFLVTASTSTTAVSGTTEQSTLASSGTLLLSSTSSNPNRIWQLRFGGSNAVAFADIGASGTTTNQWVLSGSSVVSRTTYLSGATGAPPAAGGLPVGLAATGSGAYLAVLPTSPTRFSSSGIPTFTVDQGPPFRFPPSAPSGTVFLERLADPGQPNGAGNPYIVVDTAQIDAIPDVSVGGYVPQKNRRRGPQDTPANPLAIFWTRSPFSSAWVSEGNSVLSPYSVSSPRVVPWFHWPNRPFISQAELALVPTGSASTDGVLANYSFPTNSIATSTASIAVSSTASMLGSLILDATYVPSRFAENTVTITDASINVVGLDKLQVNHFSKWREPGRVNVNTIVSGTTVLSGTTASLDDVVWTTFMGNTYVANPFTPRPARSSTIPAVPAVPPTADMPAIPAIPAIPPGPAIPASPARSISHVLSLSGSAGQPIATQDFTTSGTILFARDKNPYFNYAQAIRLANTATVQSNVFAVWITVRITDDSPNAPSPVTRRLFAIVDRSIPVGYLPNRDLNVRDVIRLRRYLD